MIENIDLIAPTFDGRLSATQYSLSIRHTSDGYSFSVTDTDGVCQLVKFSRFSNRLTAANAIRTLNAEPLLQQPYASIKYYHGGTYTVGPQALDDNSLSLPQIDSQGVFIASPHKDTVTQQINDQLSINYRQTTTVAHIIPNCTQHHYAQLLILAVLSNPVADGVWAEILPTQTTIAVKRCHKLLLLNTYQTSSPTDALYHIMACYEMLELSQTNTPLYLIDATDSETASVSEQLKQYIFTVNQLTPKLWNELPAEYQGIPIMNRFILQTI